MVHICNSRHVRTGQHWYGKEVLLQEVAAAPFHPGSSLRESCLQIPGPVTRPRVFILSLANPVPYHFIAEAVTSSLRLGSVLQLHLIVSYDLGDQGR